MAKNMLLMSTFLIAFVVTFANGNKPNIVFLLTDDQDVKLGGQVRTNNYHNHDNPLFYEKAAKFYMCVCSLGSLDKITKFQK